jgi:hypothetical protein
LTALALSSGTDVQPPGGIEFREVFVDANGSVVQPNLQPTTKLEFRPEFIQADGQVAVTMLEETPGLLTPELFVGPDGQVTVDSLDQVPGILFTELRIDANGTVLTPTVTPPPGLEYRPIFIRADGAPGTSGTPAPSPKPQQLLELDGAWPNPFNPNLEIRFRLHADGPTVVRVYDARGALVRTLLQADLAADLHVLRWDGRDASGLTVASGTYWIRVSAHGEEYTTRAVLVK